MTAILNKIFLSITMLGEAEFVIILALVISALLWYWRKKLQIIILWIVIIGSEAITYVIKAFVNRPRPDNALILEESASFPSGHATIAVAFYGFLTYLLLCKIKKYRTLTLAISIVIILALGYSRLYLRVHYLSDVLVGYLIGAVWLVIGIKIDKSKYINNNL